MKSVFSWTLAAIVIVSLCAQTAAGQETAQGRVYLDTGGNGVCDASDPGLPDVCVSNGADVVATDSQGRWALPAGPSARIFVIKPGHFSVPVNASKLPQHYFLRKGAEPLPASIDFPLLPGPPEDRFTAMVFGDPQARGAAEAGYVTHDVLDEVAGTDAALGVTLGDLAADGPGLFPDLSQRIGQIGVPWYYVMGNHDFDRGARTEEEGDDSFERCFGPSTYAFEQGKVAFIALRNVYNAEDRRQQRRFTEAQLAFVGHYLEHLPEDRLVLLMMHVPIMACSNAQAMYRLIESRAHCFSMAAHTHEQAHVFLGPEQGWNGAQPHHHFISATVCGSWWCGQKDELGIPHATMNDGAPNGYSLIDFDGVQYRIRFKAARRPADYQMNIYLPDELTAAQASETPVLVNVFAGSSKSVVEMRWDQGEAWARLEPVVAADPECQRMFELGPYLDQEVLGKKLDTVFGWKMDEPSKSRHMWKGALPANPSPGAHLLTVRTTDMFGQVYTARRIVQVR